MSMLDELAKTIPIRDFTAAERERTLKHVLEVFPVPGGRRWACAICHVLYQELPDRPELQDLALELSWIVWRIAGKVQRLQGNPKADWEMDDP